VESIVITWRELLLVVALILAVYIAEMLLLTRGGGGFFHKGRDRGSDEALLREMAELRERVAALEARQSEVAEEEEAEEVSPYQRAILLARQGRDATRISESCGISHGEAELIVSIHRPRA
jgi:hypothetical protein